MIASALTRVAARRMTSSFVAATRFVATPIVTVAPVRALHVSAAFAEPAAKAPSTKQPAVKSAAAKKPAKKTRKTAAPKKKKPEAWELFDANGKAVPLPHKSKPTRRSSFLFYVLDQFPSVSKQSEFHKVNKSTNKDGIKATAVIQAIGKQWKALSEAEKKPFNDLAAEARVKYASDLAAWEASLTPEDIERNNAYMSAQKRKGRKAQGPRLRDPAKPKKPATAFFEYLRERRAQDGSMGSSATVVEFTKQLGREWKAMSESEKEPFVLKAEGAKEQYDKDMEAYKRQQERA